MSSSNIKAKDAVFRNTEFTKYYADGNWHGGSIYCGSSSGGANVYFDNCVFEGNVQNKTLHGVCVKYTDTKVYLSNCKIIGPYTTADLRPGGSCVIYIGKNVDYKTIDNWGGTVDTITYADREFKF